PRRGAARLCTGRTGAGRRGIARDAPARAAQRAHPDPHQRRDRDPLPLHGRAAARVVLRHPGPRLDDRGCDQRQRLRDAAHDGLHRLPPLHRRADPHRPELRAGRPAGAPRMTLDGAVVGNAIALGTAALGAWVLVGTRARRTWAAAILRRSPVAFGAVLVFAGLAFLDSLAWTAGDPLGRPRSIIDRLFPA